MSWKKIYQLIRGEEVESPHQSEICLLNPNKLPRDMPTKTSVRCVRGQTTYPTDAWVAITAVTLQEWAWFIRSERYFDKKFWEDSHSFPVEKGGDVLLERVRYQWTKRNQPVTSISWYEAAAYSRAVGGRLPWLEEWQAVAGMPERIRDNNFKEWCEEWFFPGVSGPGVNALPPRRKRLGTMNDEGLAPEAYRPDDKLLENVCFRVAFPVDFV